MAHETTIAVRFSELDPYGHVNHAVYLTYFEQARCEANRCLRCFANIVLDTEACVLCALCADVCPVNVISLVPGEEVDPGAGAGQTALLLDEEACIRCGLCIERCPPKALSMAMWSGVGVPPWQ